MEHILLIEDDPELSEYLRRYLSHAGFGVTLAPDSAAARGQFSQYEFSLVILDLMLPDGEGLDLCQEFRAGSSLPIVVISARGNGGDRMLALESGADMYLAKPFDLDELVARVRACLRLYGTRAEQELLHCGDLNLEPSAHRTWVGEQEVHITPKEFDLLSELLQAKQQVCKSEELLWKVWGYTPEVRTRTLDVHIGRLRAKLRQAGTQQCHLITVPGIGYRLADQEDS